MAIGSDKGSMRVGGPGQLGGGTASHCRLNFSRTVFVKSHMEYAREMRNPGVAAVLSFFIPGVGQIYNGKILRGIFWLIVTPGLWITSGGLLGWICHLISAFTAYHYAKNHPY
jgi:TM2 domain-containing membrane protein YozV